MDLSVKYLGLDLKNPIIIGSSGLSDSAKKIINLENAGAGAVVIKSLFEEQILAEMGKSQNLDYHDYPEAHDYARYYTKEKNTNDYLDLIKGAKKSVEIPVIASINCVNSKEWTSFAKKIETAGADALEINVSMLPSNIELNSNENEQKYFDIISEVRKSIKIPIALKMSSYSAGLAQLIQKLSWTKNTDAFVLFNRYYSPDIDLHKMKIVSSNVFSTPEEISVSLRWIALLSNKIQLPLIATTGIHNSEGVVKQILAGAQAVQIVSTVYKNGNEYIGEIIRGLEDWMNKNNHKTLSDFRGLLSYDKAKGGAAFERVQFMKYFSDIT
ncbi:MAG: dihydroorotate dehydrogenase-like protein [Bacteroidales bacterium]|nr:dihydroorotate dehydrogenase-like protein [Bacteroidales bacterium]